MSARAGSLAELNEALDRLEPRGAATELPRGDFLVLAHRIAMDFGLPAALRAIEHYEHGSAGAGGSGAGQPAQHRSAG